MPWAELEAAFAAQFVDTLAESQRVGGGEPLLRERVAALSAGERRVTSYRARRRPSLIAEVVDQRLTAPREPDEQGDPDVKLNSAS